MVFQMQYLLQCFDPAPFTSSLIDVIYSSLMNLETLKYVKLKLLDFQNS